MGRHSWAGTAARELKKVFLDGSVIARLCQGRYGHIVGRTGDAFGQARLLGTELKELHGHFTVDVANDLRELRARAVAALARRSRSSRESGRCSSPSIAVPCTGRINEVRPVPGEASSRTNTRDHQLCIPGWCVQSWQVETMPLVAAASATHEPSVISAYGEPTALIPIEELGELRSCEIGRAHV